MVFLDLEKCKTLSQKHPEPGEAGHTGRALGNKRLDCDMTYFNQEVTENVAVLKERLHFKKNIPEILNLYTNKLFKKNILVPNN